MLKKWPFTQPVKMFNKSEINHNIQDQSSKDGNFPLSISVLKIDQLFIRLQVFFYQSFWFNVRRQKKLTQDTSDLCSSRFMNLTGKYIQVLYGNTLPITTFVNSFVYPWLQDYMGASHCWVRRETAQWSCWQWGCKEGSTQKGWIIRCHSFVQSNCAMENKQISKDLHCVPVLEAALALDCPCCRDSASSFSFGTNPSALSLLKAPFRL